MKFKLDPLFLRFYVLFPFFFLTIFKYSQRKYAIITILKKLYSFSLVSRPRVLNKYSIIISEKIRD